MQPNLHFIDECSSTHHSKQHSWHQRTHFPLGYSRVWDWSNKQLQMQGMWRPLPWKEQTYCTPEYCIVLLANLGWIPKKTRISLRWSTQTTALSFEVKTWQKGSENLMSLLWQIICHNCWTSTSRNCYLQQRWFNFNTQTSRSLGSRNSQTPQERRLLLFGVWSSMR